MGFRIQAVRYDKKLQRITYIYDSFSLNLNKLKVKWMILIVQQTASFTE